MSEMNLTSNNVLLGLSVEELDSLLPGYQKYTYKQIYDFLTNGVDFDLMSSLKKELREYLNNNFVANPISIQEVFTGKEGTKKYLLRLLDDNLIEAVYMPHNYGNTLCISTQIGCRMGCKFCASTLEGLVRNLTASEMLGQVIAINKDNGGNKGDRAITNIVLMGSGEPFDNYDNVLKFLTLVNDENGLNISERNISLSTSGLVEKIKEFANSGHKVTLSISLHAPFNEIRSNIMPINNAYPVEKLVDAAKYYFNKTGRRVIFEYTLIKDVNDSIECAKRLSTLLKGFPAHVNLIRLNEVKERDLSAPTVDATQEFLEKLEKLGVSCTIRKSLGNDIEGACGQLRRRYIKENE